MAISFAQYRWVLRWVTWWGGLVDKHYGWRMAFFVAGVPGLLLAALCLLLRDPPRGVQDTAAAQAAGGVQAQGGAGGAPSAPPPTRCRGPLRPAPCARRRGWPMGTSLRNTAVCADNSGIRRLHLRRGRVSRFGCRRFSSAARGIPRSEATVSVGAIVVITGFIGTFVGGWVGRLLRQVFTAGPIFGCRQSRP